jgi:hypothetical protein
MEGKKKNRLFNLALSSEILPFFQGGPLYCHVLMTELCQTSRTTWLEYFQKFVFEHLDDEREPEKITDLNQIPVVIGLSFQSYKIELAAVS